MITESNVFTALRAYLKILFPSYEVVKGFDNLVPMPMVPFIVMSPLLSQRLASNEIEDGEEERYISRSTKFTIQIDFFGNNSLTDAVTFSTLWRDDEAVKALESAGIAPLDCTDVRQMNFENSENQYEVRYNLDIDLQYRPTVTIAQQTADELEVTAITVITQDVL
jgi:hypothetical protein